MTLDERLRQLATAEEFLAFFKVAFDPSRLPMIRLHLLARFREYKAAIDSCHGNETQDQLKEKYARALTLAYDDCTQPHAAPPFAKPAGGGCSGCAGTCEDLHSRPVATPLLGRMDGKV